MEFDVSTKYSYEEYRRYSKEIMKKGSHAMGIYACGAVLIIAIAAYRCLVSGLGIYGVIRAIPSFIVYLLFGVIIKLGTERGIKKTWESNDIIKDAVVNYHFTPEGFSVSGVGSNGFVTYDKIWKLLETDTNFYPMIQNNLGYIIDKSALSIEQRSYIWEMCNKNKGTVDKAGEVPDDSGQHEEPLYMAKTVITFREYLRFNVTVLSKLFHLPLIICSVFVIAILYQIVSNGTSQLLVILVMYVLPLIISLMILICLYVFLTYRGWKTNALMRDHENILRFYPDRIEVTEFTGNAVITYAQIFRKIETKSNIYLMIANNQGYILRKSECSAELLEFIGQKIK